MIFFTESNEVLVRPIDAVVILPEDDSPPIATTILFCGIVPDTTDYSTTWTTPNGVSITVLGPNVTTSEDNKFIVQNGVGSAQLPQLSTLFIMGLVYADAGNYTCSVTFTGGENNASTEEVTFTLSLLGKYD